MKETTTTQRAVLVFSILILLTPILVFANPDAPLKNSTGGSSLGVSVQEWQDDFGSSLILTSPWFLYEKAALRVSGTVLFKEDTQWKPYYALRAGLLGGSFMQSADIRLYGEGGLLVVFPDRSFDSTNLRMGGYGHFGFEFFLNSWPGTISYFIELGSNGIVTSTITGGHYLNGFATTCGFRFYP